MSMLTSLQCGLHAWRRRGRWRRCLVAIRPHQEDFGKGIPRVFFSGIYPYSRDISVQAPYPYPVNDQLPDTRQSGSRRVSKSITRTLDFEESDTLDGLLNGNFCHKSMRGKLQRGSVWAKWPTSHIVSFDSQGHRGSSWLILRHRRFIWRHRRFLKTVRTGPSMRQTDGVKCPPPGSYDERPSWEVSSDTWRHDPHRNVERKAGILSFLSVGRDP